MAGPSTGAASGPAADRLDEKVAQFSDRQSLYNAPVFVIENQAALAIDLRAAAIRLWTSLLLRNRKVTTNVIQPPARGPVVSAPLGTCCAVGGVAACAWPMVASMAW